MKVLRIEYNCYFDDEFNVEIFTSDSEDELMKIVKRRKWEYDRVNYTIDDIWKIKNAKDFTC
ncbi:MAG: hypothetical protein ACRCXT_08990 [Paraclostridium sp.]